ncbi:gliding motility protein GldL [Tenacibaculum ovolyticum]|uniref:gliding motility protein GldL n=1 Tax=Tenacibaculum ovolyticum TaxID=104270 RepID=UPI003BAB44BC
MKSKQIITVFIVGIIFIILAIVFKVLHWMLAPELLAIGTLLLIISFILFTIKLFTSKKFKDILNK